MKEVYKGYTINIEKDLDPLNPRTEFDNLGKMVCFHDRYDLGDKDHGINHNDFNSWKEMFDHIKRTEIVAVILPLYLYDHSGITISS